VIEQPGFTVEAITVDWNYRRSDPEPEEVRMERQPSVSVVNRRQAFDPRRIPELPDQFFSLTPADLKAEIDAQKRRESFQGKSHAPPKKEGRIKFQFDYPELLDLIVGATFSLSEPTCRLFEFLNEFVFVEGSVFTCALVGGKQIPSTKNQRLLDVKITGNSVVTVRVKQFAGLRDGLRAQFEQQVEALQRAVDSSATQ
jgi:hypothetical protein